MKSDVGEKWETSSKMRRGGGNEWWNGGGSRIFTKAGGKNGKHGGEVLGITEV